jgi:hypothetical protein
MGTEILTKESNIERVSLELSSSGAPLRDFIDLNIIRNFKNSYLDALVNSAQLPQKIGFTTDIYGVDSVFFLGGLGFLWLQALELLLHSC